MYDPRPLERISSIVFLVPLIILPVVTGVGLALLGIGEMVSAGTFYTTGAACCGTVGVPLLTLPLLLLLKWSRTGEAKPFLEAVAANLGGGEVSTASLVWSMLSPRLEAAPDGRPVTFSLRRQAGFLSPSRVGAQRAIFGWMFTVKMPCAVGVKVGFGPPGAAVGASLLGLHNPQPAQGLNLWSGPTDRGRWLVDHPTAQDAARRAVTFGHRHGCILRVGPQDIGVSGFLRPDVTPDMVAAFLHDLTIIASVADG